MLCIPQRCELSRVSDVLADLVIEAGIHANDHAVGRFEMLEGKFEGGLDFVGLVAHPTSRQYFEAQAGLIDLPCDFGHGKRIRSEERVPYLSSDHRRHLLQLVLRPREVVKASHKQIDLPSLVGDSLDAIGIVCRNTGQHACVLDTLDKIMDFIALALAEQSVGNAAVMNDGDWLGLSHHLGHRHFALPAGVKADELNPGTALPQCSQDRAHSLRSTALMCIYALALTAPEELGDPIVGEVLFHVPVHDRAHVRISASGIRAGDQSGDAVLAEPYRRQRRRR